MRKLHLDLVTTAWWQQPVARAGRGLLGALALLLVLAATAVAWRWFVLERERGALARIVAQSRGEILQRSAPPPAPLLLSAQQVTAINGVVEQLNIPWSELLDGFESAVTGDVALLQIEPDARRRLLRAVAETRTHQQMLDYLARLREVAAFRQAMVSKQEINEKDVNRPLRFTFEVPLAGARPGDAQRSAAAGVEGER